DRTGTGKTDRSEDEFLDANDLEEWVAEIYHKTVFELPSNTMSGCPPCPPCPPDPCADPCPPDPCEPEPDPCKPEPDPCEPVPDPCEPVPDPCEPEPAPATDPCPPDPCEAPASPPDPCKEEESKPAEVELPAPPCNCRIDNYPMNLTTEINKNDKC
ncbi:hypothetical protein Ocin01_08867, partial [Orchesella cincta]